MNILFYLLLTLHIIGGVTGLLTGSVNLTRRKGDKLHRSVGKVFTFAMLAAAISALGLSVIHPNYFLFIIGSFTIYLVGTGNRYLYLKMLGHDVKPNITDWVLTLGMMVLGMVFILSGTVRVSNGNSFGIAYIVFGAIGLSSVRKDLANYRGKAHQRHFWLAAHIQRMTGAYIAALTAFLVVNAQFMPFQLPSLVAWLLPTIVLTPLIFKWTAKYAGKKV